jgi:hypothetical protein
MTAGDTIKVFLVDGLTASGVTSDTMTCSLRILANSVLTTSSVTTCTYNSNDGGSRTITFTTVQSYTSISFIRLIVTSLQNPDSARTLADFTVSVGSESSTFSSGISYTADDLASASVANEVQTAGTPTTMTFTFRINNPIPQGGRILITYPSEVEFTKASADGYVSVTIYGTVMSGFTATLETSPVNGFRITNLFSSSSLAVQSSDIVVAISQLRNPKSQITSSSFAIYTLDSDNREIDRRTTGLTVQSTSPGTISIITFVPTSYIVDGKVTVTFFEETDLRAETYTIRVYWPSEITYDSSQSLTCTKEFGFDPLDDSCTVDTSNNYVSLTSYKEYSHYYTIGTFINPLGAMTTSTWQLIVYDSSDNIIMQKTSDITYTTTVNSISVTSSTRPSGSTTVGIRADHTVVFVPTSRMLSDSTVKLVFPIDQVKYDGSTTCFSGSTNLGCTLSDVNSTHFQTEITQWCNAGAECAAGTSISFVLTNAINPSWVTSPLTSTVQIYTINNQLSGNPIIDQLISGVQFTPTLTPGTLTNIVVAKDSSTNKVGEQTSYVISFTVVTEILANGQVKFTFPSNAVYKASGTAIVCTETVSSTVKTCTSTSDTSGMVTDVTISDACTAGCSTGAALSYTLTQVYNPGSTKPISTTFQSNTQTSEGYLIDSGTAATTSGFDLVVNSFTSITVNSPSGNIVVGEITEYKFTIVLKNAIPSSGGQLLITFPSEIAVQSSGSCTAVISSTTHVCTKDQSANTVTATFNSDAAAGSSLVITITNGVKNPTVGDTSNVITFASTVTESGTIYGIDTDSTSITVTPNTYGTLTSTSVTRVDSSKINEATNLNIKATSANPILANSVVTISIPIDQAVLDVADVDALTFYQLDSSDNVGSQITTSSRSSNSTYYTIIFTITWCANGATDCPAGSENIKVRATGFKNPSSTLPPSNSFIIKIDTNGSLKIDSKESSLFATPSIQAGPLTDVTISRDTNVVGAATIYTIGFTTTNSLTETNGIYLTVTPPSGLLYEGSSVSCEYNSAAVSPSSNCLVSYNSVSYGNEVASFRIPLACSSTS